MFVSAKVCGMNVTLIFIDYLSNLTPDQNFPASAASVGTKEVVTIAIRKCEISFMVLE